MPRQRWSGLQRFGVALCMLLLCAGAATPAVSQEIWFSPLSPPQGPKDYMELFQPNAPWQRAEAHVKVFEISYAFVLTASDADLRTIFTYLHQRHLGLLIGIPALSGLGPGACGYHVEGYGAHGGPYGLARKLKALGAEPTYFGMDEPLYHGHVFGPQNGTNGCHSSFPDLARDIADSIQQMRTFLPGVPAGTVEPLSFAPNNPWFKDDAWLHDIGQFADAYQAAVGEKLAFFRLDMWWPMPWQQHMQALTSLLRRKGIPLQVIYNGNGGDKTDAIWMAHAVEAFKAFESGPWPRPDAALIQFWDPHPSRMLPETDPLTATGLIDQYIQWQQTHK